VHPAAAILISVTLILMFGEVSIDSCHVDNRSWTVLLSDDSLFYDWCRYCRRQFAQDMDWQLEQRWLRLFVFFFLFSTRFLIQSVRYAYGLLPLQAVGEELNDMFGCVELEIGNHSWEAKAVIFSFWKTHLKWETNHARIYLKRDMRVKTVWLLY